jgi:hypothetical protein
MGLELTGMLIFALMILVLLFGVASMAAFDEGKPSPEKIRLSLIAAGLAGMMMGVVFSPAPPPTNWLFGFGFAITFMLMIVVAAAPRLRQE